MGDVLMYLADITPVTLDPGSLQQLVYLGVLFASHSPFCSDWLLPGHGLGRIGMDWGWISDGKRV